jgi:hypothetical protein
MSRTTSRFALDLDTLKYIQLPTPIQVQRRGISRRLHPNEALALVLGALGTLARLSGVKTINTIIDGQPVALALIQGARFGEDSNGDTTLNEVTANSNS